MDANFHSTQVGVKNNRHTILKPQNSDIPIMAYHQRNPSTNLQLLR